MELNYEKIDDKEFCERAQLIEYNVTALLERGKFLPMLHTWTTKKFNCTANFAVSSKSSIAVIASDGELNIMQIKDDRLVLKSQVRVLTDPYCEFRLIEWNSDETLLFSTRSSAVMDVFNANGMFLYKVPMFDGTDGSVQIICQLRSNPLTEDENFSDDVYTLQIDGTLSAFRVGKEAYHRLFTVNLGPSPLCSMVYSPKYNILISCGEFQRSLQSEEDMDSSAFGMNVHRIVDGFPYVDCIKQSIFKKAWHERIPFLSDKKSIVICAEISPDQQNLLAVTSTGDLLLFALPSLRLIQSLVPENDRIVPVQVGWSGNKDFVILNSNGQITRANTDDYFNGIYADYQLNHLENCKRLRIVNSTTYALTEIRLDSIVTPDENKQRVGAELSLFVIFHLTFLLRLLKAFFSFIFGGDATRDLSEKIGVEQSAQLALFTTKNLTLNEYIEKCMQNKNYQLAISLAEPVKDFFDLDIIYKRQWEDLKQARSISEEHLEVLRSVHDKLWVAEECLKLDTRTSVKLHETALKLASIVVKNLENEKLRSRVINAAQILSIIRKAVPRDEDACELYLKFRNSTILTFTFAMAEETNFDLLRCLFEKHGNELHNYLLPILNAIPESTEPSKYEEFLPYLNKEKASDGRFVLNKSDQFVLADSTKIPAKYAEFSDYLLGQENIDDNELFEKWCRSRVELIDSVSGLYEDCVTFLNLVIEHGYKDLTELRDQYKLYNSFIVFSHSTNITFKQFLSSDAQSIQATLATHITRTDLIENLEQVVRLIEFADKDRGKATEQILSLVCSHSAQGFELLYALKRIRPEILTTENLVQCFLASKSVGDQLTSAMKELNLPSGLVIVVEFCSQVKADETFSEIHSAINDSNKASQLIQRFVHGNCVLPIKNRNDEWWRDLLAKTRQLRHSAFEQVVTDEQILRFICQEMINSVCRELNPEIPPSRQAPFHLVVDLTGTASSANISLLKQSVFEELIVEKSKDFIDSSIPDLEDASLKRASLVLDALRTGNRMPRLLASQKRSIDIIKLSLELGSKRVPASFAYCSKEIILSEIVNTKNNYKNVKACAEVAKLLELSTPSARALADASICALNREDIKTTKMFVNQLAKSAKDFGVVYELAKTILEREIDDDELNDDALACLIHNCPEDDLNNALAILSDYRNKKSSQKSQLDLNSESSGISYPDPLYTSIKKLHLFDFDSANMPLKIPNNTYQADVFMSLENNFEASQRVQQNAELKQISEAIQVLQEKGTHPFILENLESKHYRKIAKRLGKKIKKEEKLESDEDDVEDEEDSEEEF